jgi:hypothetical protein
VNVQDVFIVASYDGQTVPPAPIQADMDLDGDVDEDDIARMTHPYWIMLHNLPCQDAPIGPSGNAVGGVAEPAGRSASRGSVVAPLALFAGALVVAGAGLFVVRRID